MSLMIQSLGINRRSGRMVKPVSVLIVTLAIFLAVLTGLFAVFLPWTILVPLVLLPVMGFIAVIFPEAGIAALLAAIFGAIPPFLLPNLPVGGGSVRPEDLGIAAFILLLLVRNLGGNGSRLAFLRPYLAPLILLGGSVVLSAAYAFYYARTPARDIFNEVRPYYYWLLLVLLPLAIDDDLRLKRLTWLLMALALILGMGMVLQSFAGVQIFQRGAFRDVYTMGDAAQGVIRSTSPGMFLMAGALLYLIGSFVTSGSSRVLLTAAGGFVLALGLLVGFGRGLWLSVILGVLVLALFARFGRYLTFMLVSMIAAVVALSVLNFAKPDYVAAAADRLMSVAPELSHGSSFGRRIIENRYAVERVLGSPLVGAGLGVPYKPPTLESRGWDGETRYIHNAYVNVATKLGLPGLVSMVWLVLLVLHRAWSALRQSANNRALNFALFWTTLTVVGFTAMTQPNLVSTNGVATLCVAIFLIERFRHRHPLASDSKLAA